ncbi:MAG: phosphopantothenoylcysteine decarboxylase [Fodinibius sp.]|nr:phosphopantothenoylcysteine decarboxylase [Fodinibius sp.]
MLKECRTILEDQQRSDGPLAGKKVVVTAGPTREYLDPVRFISNPSSGKMGFAMAEAAQQLGAEVILIHGPVTIEKPADIATTEIAIGTSDFFEQVQNHADADVVIMAAAVSDFTSKEIHQQKVKKDKADSSIQLKQTPDILAWLGDHKKNGQVLIGFAMETENLLENAKDKLERKNADWIVANALNEDDSGFASDKNKVHLIGQNDSKQIEGLKPEVARHVLAHIFKNR